MDENNVFLNDPDETAADVDLNQIHEDWNRTPEENWGTGELEDEDQREQNSQTDEAITADDETANDKMSGSDADQSFTLKHLSAVKTVGRDEVITLAQKGLDYDRIRGKLEEASAELGKSDEALSLFKEMAAAQGITAQQLIDSTRAQMLVQRDGIAPSLAAEHVTAMRAAKGSIQERSTENTSSEKRQTEIREFLAEYGTGIDPKSIPPEVWQSVAKGKTLLSAYQAWELKKLRADSTAARKNSENKIRSAGSRVTFGNQRPRDVIADDWYES